MHIFRQVFTKKTNIKTDNCRKIRKGFILVLAGLFLLAGIILPFNRQALAANIGNSSGYAWSEKTGFVNFSGADSSADYGVTVTSTVLSGYAWSEETGWINFNDAGSLYAVTNDGAGNLSGYAWSEKLGWISFEDTGPSNYYQVAINGTGEFSGYAWSEKAGYINMNDLGALYAVSIVNAPESVAASDGTFNDRVRVTWDVAEAATGYKVWDGASWIDVGNVTQWDDMSAPAPSITGGVAAATDGTSISQVSLSIAGASVSDGVAETYKVKAYNGGGEGAESATDTGYRLASSLNYQWQRSAADSDAAYSNINGATTAAYNDTDAPAPTITAGAASATDGTSTTQVSLSVAGAGIVDGAGRYYKAYLTSTGATPAYSAADRGYRVASSLNYQWQRSAADSDAAYSDIGGATTALYDDTTAPAPIITAGSATASDGTTHAHVALSLNGESTSEGAGRYFRLHLTSTGANAQDTTGDRGYRSVGALSYQWKRSAADSDAAYSDIGGATTESYNDTGAPADGTGRYYHCVLNASGAAQQSSAVDRGFREGMTLTTNAATGTGLDSATLNGTIDTLGTGNATERGFKYGLTQVDTWSVSEAGSFSTGAYSLPVTSLNPGQRYYVRAYAVDNAGTHYGSYISFQLEKAPLFIHRGVNFLGETKFK